MYVIMHSSHASSLLLPLDYYVLLKEMEHRNPDLKVRPQQTTNGVVYRVVLSSKSHPLRVVNNDHDSIFLVHNAMFEGTASRSDEALEKAAERAVRGLENHGYGTSRLLCAPSCLT